jgi:hypothetical protein
MNTFPALFAGVVGQIYQPSAKNQHGIVVKDTNVPSSMAGVLASG